MGFCHVSQSGLKLLASSDPISASQKMRFRHVDQSGLEFLISGDLPASASQSAGITGEKAHKSSQAMLSLGMCSGFIQIPAKRNWQGMNKGRSAQKQINQMSCNRGSATDHELMQAVPREPVPRALEPARWVLPCYPQADLELLTLSDLPASAFQSAQITGMSHHTWPELYTLK
ncbi:Protein GVQW1, partial [Plecturocebus cupreus]